MQRHRSTLSGPRRRIQPHHLNDRPGNTFAAHLGRRTEAVRCRELPALRRMRNAPTGPVPAPVVLA
ncbi:hypothetical protein C5N14_28400 [Micromonospora sp. MW-13]|uniref:hypothetical protein n=1 Tax=Micromonospora sp. MW-13 TaxID=2094022 RepID=UPI000EC6426A|nr:hypothetical protein [Micromonospora sp. MW-13]RGC65528.1 hypothetical protein C5N14_28400 [Micromonospora sp. MW-13]